MRQRAVLMAVLSGFLGSGPVSAQTIWDQWFTVSGPGGRPEGYFREKFEERGSKYVYSVDTWTREGESVREEKVVAEARARSSLDPLAFRRQRGTLKIESVRSAAGRGPLKTRLQAEGRPETKTESALPFKAVLSPFLPVWLGMKSALAQPGRTITMSAVTPDGGPIKGQTIRVSFEARDPYARKHRAGKVGIARPSGAETWWVDERGLPVRIERADHGVIERADEAKARAFLERST